MADEASQAASSGLFGVFLLSIFSLFLIPYTLYHLCSLGEESTTQPVAKKQRSSAGDRLRAACTKSNLTLLLLWVAWVVVLLWTQASMAEHAPFDPFEILGVPRDANERDVKKAYRKLSLLYHPDKNPDPAAAAYFASHISKAYAALTDEVSRQNYEKYGHPDGPQGMNLGVALPSWMFSRDKKAAPLMLLGLVGVGILLPLGLMSWYMLSSSKFSGPNNIMNETYGIFLYSKFNVKESQSLVRIPETLLCAMEFITLYTPPQHTAPLEELRKAVAPYYGELMAKSNKSFWQRKASVVKAHMLLLAHLERLGDEVPPALQADLKFVRSKAPLLLEEMVKIACMPRTAAGTGWMAPAMASVEMMQCLAQALPVSMRKSGSGKGADGLAQMLQLPGINSEALKKLRKRKINTLAELAALSEGARATELSWAGLDKAAAEGVSLFVAAMPRLSVAACLHVDADPEAEPMEGDRVTCKVRVLLTRAAHSQPGYELRGSSVRAYTPFNPVPRDEAWWVFLTDPVSNAVLAFEKVNLMDAERQGLAHPAAAASAAGAGAGDSKPAGSGLAASSSSPALAAAGDAKANGTAGAEAGTNGCAAVAASAAPAAASAGAGDEDVPGQELLLHFWAPKPGTHSLQLTVMSDSWVGVDETVPMKLRVLPVTKAALEAREAAAVKAAAVKAPRAFDSETDSDSQGGSGSECSDDYDSEETGEEESGSESEPGSDDTAGSAAGSDASGRPKAADRASS